MARDQDPDDDFERRPGWQLPGAPDRSPEPYGTPPPPSPRPDSGRSAGGPPARVLQNGFAGEARNVATTSLPSGTNAASQTVVTFRLEQHSASSGRAGMVTVRLRGSDVLGFVSDGDWVEVEGKLKRGFVEGRRAVNRTSGAEFRGGAGGMGCLRVGFTIVFAIFFLAVVVFIIGVITQSMP